MPWELQSLLNASLCCLLNLEERAVCSYKAMVGVISGCEVLVVVCLKRIEEDLLTAWPSRTQLYPIKPLNMNRKPLSWRLKPGCLIFGYDEIVWVA